MSDAEKKPQTPAEDRFGAADVVRFALEKYTLGRSTDGSVFVTSTNPKDPRIAREVRGLRSEISRALWRERGLTVGRDTVGTAMETLYGLAEDAPVSKVYLRSAKLGPSIHVDLGDTSGRFVEVSPYGWTVRDPREEDDVTASRPIFRRTAAGNALPAPEEGGTRDDLRELLGLAEDDPRWKLAWGWLVASLFEDVPRPILWTLGPQGSGKSTRARMILNVVDPVDALGREPGRNERDDTTAASGRFLPSWDNIGNVSAATSDWLCRIVTGVEIGRRALYTDDDLRVSTLRRSGVATSIVLPFGLGPDALERLVLLELERVSEEDRRAESELWARFERLHGRILGALLDDVAGVLAHLHEARHAGHKLPRMADYALILHALDIHADEDDLDGYAAVYTRSVRGVLADRATSDPLTAALLKQVKSHGGEWTVGAEILLRAIEVDRPDDPRAAWPTSASSLSAALMKSHETLRAAGLEVERKRTKKGSSITLRAVETEDNDLDDAEDEVAGETPENVVTFAPRPLKIDAAPDVDEILGG
ncbi:hypothetical protein [uncultured Arthrobacter sp.]|uniref:hypothetical protein n=1 Tax=uncultured Arthrobacter sp. TaxID=114050 RepID=UPI00321638F8